MSIKKEQIKLFIKALVPNWFFAAIGTIIGSIYFILGEGSILAAAIGCLFISTMVFTGMSHKRTEILSLLSAVLIVFFNYNLRSEFLEYQDIEQALNKEDVYLKVISSPKDMFFRSNLIVELKEKKKTLPSIFKSIFIPTRLLGHSDSSKAISKGDLVKIPNERKLEKINKKKIQFYKKDKVFFEIKKPDLVFTKTPKSFVNKLQNKIRNYYHSTLSRDNAEIVSSLLFGSRSGEIPQSFISTIRRLGLGHFFAASGFHLLVLTLVLTWLLNLFRLKESQKSLILIPITILYAALAGFSPSIVRAAVCIISFFILKLLKRKAWSLKFLIYLAGLILFIDPYTAFDIGFQLSYLSTFSLILWSNSIKEKFSNLKIPGYFKEILIVTLSVQIFLLPLVIYYFNSLQVWSVLANLLFTPILSLVIVFSFFGLSFLLEPLLKLVNYLVIQANQLPYLNSHLEINITTAVLLFILLNSFALLVFTKHDTQDSRFNLNKTLDEMFSELFQKSVKNTYMISSVTISALLLVLAVNLDPIGMKKIIIENGVVANQKITAFNTKKNYEYFKILGKDALIIKDRSSLEELSPLLDNIKEVDLLFLPNLNSKDIYLSRLVSLINPQFTITNYGSKTKSERVKKNLSFIGEKSHTIVNSGLIYISEDKFWALKK